MIKKIEKLFILVVGLFLIAGIIFVISGLRFIPSFPITILSIIISFSIFSFLNLVLIIFLFVGIFRSTQKPSLVILSILMLCFFSSVFFNWNNTLDLLFGPSNECGIFGFYDRETNNYRSRRSYIYLKNEPKSVLFDITKNSFEKLGIKENEKICWQKWRSVENTNLKKSSE